MKETKREREMRKLEDRCYENIKKKIEALFEEEF